MDNKFKSLVMIALILYTISPDPVPGPIDDIVLWVVYAIYQRRIEGA